MEFYFISLNFIVFYKEDTYTYTKTSRKRRARYLCRLVRARSASDSSFSDDTCRLWPPLFVHAAMATRQSSTCSQCVWTPARPSSAPLTCTATRRWPTDCRKSKQGSQHRWPKHCSKVAGSMIFAWPEHYTMRKLWKHPQDGRTDPPLWGIGLGRHGDVLAGPPCDRASAGPLYRDHGLSQWDYAYRSHHSVFLSANVEVLLRGFSPRFGTGFPRRVV